MIPTSRKVQTKSFFYFYYSYYLYIKNIFYFKIILNLCYNVKLFTLSTSQSVDNIE